MRASVGIEQVGVIHMIVEPVTKVSLNYLTSGDLRTFNRVALNSRSLMNMGGYRGIDQDNIIHIQLKSKLKFFMKWLIWNILALFPHPSSLARRISIVQCM